MLSKVKKWGNSQGIRIPKNILEDSCISVGEEIDITVEKGKIVLESTIKIHGRYNIQDLVNDMPANYEVNEEDWGSAVGKEFW